MVVVVVVVVALLIPVHRPLERDESPALPTAQIIPSVALAVSLVSLLWRVVTPFRLITSIQRYARARERSEKVRCYMPLRPRERSEKVRRDMPLRPVPDRYATYRCVARCAPLHVGMPRDVPLLAASGAARGARCGYRATPGADGAARYAAGTRRLGA